MLLKVGELASRSGLTVRALHHFDEIGLLKASARSGGGYRLYSRDDVARLHGIQARRHLGLPLKEIGAMLAGDGSALPMILARQMRGLDHEIARASELRERLALMLERFSEGAQPEMADWLLSLEMMSTYARYFSANEIKRILGNWHRVEAEWPALEAELRRMMDCGVAATDLAVQPLAHRWMSLIHHWLDGDFSLIERWGTMYKAEPAAREKEGPDLAVVRYVEQATDLRMARWRAHFTLDDLSRFRWVPLTEWRALELQIQTLIDQRAAADGPAAQAACDATDILVSRAVGDDPVLLKRLSTALAAEPVLRAGVPLGAESLNFLQAVRAARATHAGRAEKSAARRA